MESKVTLTIYGNKYSITTSENPQYVRSLAKEIDEVVTGLMRQGGISINQALMLAALNYADLHKKADEGADNLRRQIKEYADDAAKARAELNEQRKGAKSKEKANV